MKLLILLRSNVTQEVENRKTYYCQMLNILQDRLLLIPHLQTKTEYNELFGKVDIILDPFPYSGTTTTCNAYGLICCKNGCGYWNRDVNGATNIYKIAYNAVNNKERPNYLSRRRTSKIKIYIIQKRINLLVFIFSPKGADNYIIKNIWVIYIMFHYIVAYYLDGRLHYLLFYIL